MSKRFIDTEAHKVELRKADLKIRFTLDWLWKNCDAAGIWEVDADLFKFETGFDLDLEGLLKTCPWVKRLPTGPLFIPEFVTTNYGKLKEGYNPHKPVLRSLEAHGIDPSTLQFQDLGKSSRRLVDEGEEEDKKLEKERAPATPDLPFSSDRYLEAWRAFEAMRKKIPRAPWTDYARKLVIEKLGKMSEADGIKALENAIEGSWRSVFPPKPTATDNRKRTEPDRNEEVTLGKRLAFHGLKASRP